MNSGGNGQVLLKESHLGGADGVQEGINRTETLEPHFITDTDLFNEQMNA